MSFEYGTNLSRRSQGLPYSEEMLRREIGNGLRGAHPGASDDYDTDDRMEDELRAFARSGDQMEDRYATALQLREMELQPEVVVAELESHIDDLLKELERKFAADYLLTQSDVSVDDVHIAEAVCLQREEMVEIIKGHDPLYVAGIEALAERVVAEKQPTEDSVLITKIDAMDQLIVELESEVDDTVESEDPHFLEVAVAVRNKYVAELNKEQMAYYYALAA